MKIDKVTLFYGTYLRFNKIKMIPICDYNAIYLLIFIALEVKLNIRR